MSIQANDLRKGDVVLYEDKLYLCLKAERRVMGRKSAFVQVIFRNVRDGLQKDIKFASSDKLEKVDLFVRSMQFLYKDGESFHFMDQKTYDQIEIHQSFIGEKEPFLTDSMVVNVTFYENTPIDLELPKTMEFDITEADPEIKGATATAQYKSATIDIGLTIKVPPFVNVGDRVKINTETLEYMERVKK